MPCEMRLSVRAAQIKTLQSAFDSIKDLIIAAVSLEFSPRGMKLMAFDGPNVAMVNLDLQAHGFWSYQCEGARSIGVRVPDILRAIKACSGVEEMVMSMPSDATELKFTGMPARGQTKIEYKLANLTVEQPSINVPKAEWDQTIQIPTKDFKRNISVCSQIADNVRIVWDGGVLSFEANEDNKQCRISIDTVEKVVNKTPQLDEQDQKFPTPLNFQPYGGPLRSLHQAQHQAQPGQTQGQTQGQAQGPAQPGQGQGQALAHTSSQRQTLQGPNQAQEFVPPVPRIAPLMPVEDSLVNSVDSQSALEYYSIPEPMSPSIVAPDGLASVKATFALRYLNWFTKAEPLNAVVRVLLRPDFPLCLTYEIIEWGELTFCVSPIVDDSDSD